jgi:hypothetical protein
MGSVTLLKGATRSLFFEVDVVEHAFGQHRVSRSIGLLEGAENVLLVGAAPVRNVEGVEMHASAASDERDEPLGHLQQFRPSVIRLATPP